MNVRSGIAIIALALALPAAADTTLHYRVSRGDTVVPIVLKARAGEIRAEGPALGGQFEWMIYRNADDTLYAVDPQNKTFLALDPAAIDTIARRLDALKANLRERLKRMPVGQRKFIESQIGDFLNESEGGRATLDIDMSGIDGKVNDIPCRKGEITSRGRPVGELCVASADDLGLSRAELDAYQGLYNLINGLQAAMSSDAANTPEIAALNGVPISMSIPSNGLSQALQGVAHAPLPDRLFAIPDSYRRLEPQDLLR